MEDLLKDKFSVSSDAATRGTRSKIITILMKTWVTVPDNVQSFRNDGLDMIRYLKKEDRTAVHWGLAMAVYPFWAVVALYTGRLLKLQGTAAAAHIQRRVREQYGQRVTVSDAAGRVLRSFVDWGVLSDTNRRGIYKQGLVQPVDDIKLSAWLVEACLYARRSSSAVVEELLDNPALFPFKLGPISAQDLVKASSRLDMFHHGFDHNMVMLKG